MKPDIYAVRYHRHFASLRSEATAVLELGIAEGDSLEMWRDFFARATIVGLDLKPCPLPEPGGQVRIYQGSQDDLTLLDRIARECAPDGFDLIVDDCAHVGELAKKSFWHLFDHYLKPTGVYVLEDWGTGYWPQWFDGQKFEQRPDRRRRRATEFPSHSAGMPGLLKQLMDECAATDIRTGGSSYRSPHKLIGRLDIYMGQAFVFPYLNPEYP
ncbi:MAG: hypothetical protein ACRD96_09615 [Bryobacteraceae bacterium]